MNVTLKGRQFNHHNEKFSKTIFINVGKNIVTQNFYSIKKKSSGIEKKNVILI